MIRLSNSLAVQGGRAPIQRLDLAYSTTAPLELPCMANQMCVIDLATQHPVQPHGQFASDGHFGHAAAPAKLQALIDAPQLGIQPRRRLSGFHQQQRISELPCLLIGPRCC